MIRLRAFAQKNKVSPELPETMISFIKVWENLNRGGHQMIFAYAEYEFQSSNIFAPYIPFHRTYFDDYFIALYGLFINAHFSDDNLILNWVISTNVVL